MLGALESPEIVFAVLLTAKTVVVAAVLFLLCYPPLAWLLARRKGLLVRALSFLTTLPLVFPPIALGYLLLLLFGRNGLLGSLLSDAGIAFVFTPVAVYFAAFVAGLPLVVRPLKNALESEMLQAIEFTARVHGATPFTVFRRITMPLVRPHLAAGLLLGLTRASGEVGITMMLGGNISDRTNTLSLEIFNAVSRAEFDAATALCLLLTIFTFVVFCLLEIIQKRAVKL